jgi:Mlc titration factor MtfA (ptsG expression regulator)
VSNDLTTMVLSWFKHRRRSKLRAQTFPAAWAQWLSQNVLHYRDLGPNEQAALREIVQVLIAEKNWEGCGGLTLGDEIKVTIAAQAALLLLAIDHDYFPRVLSILVYPTEYLTPHEYIGPDGVVHEGLSNLGEAWYRGPVILSWDDAAYDGLHPYDGENLVLHEFAHQLDMEDRETDGTPPLAARGERRRWQQVMETEYQQLIEDTEQGRRVLLDEYGATDRAEFFAVATECFFERPSDMQRRHPDLYHVLRSYYRQDPAARLSPTGRR